MDLIDREAILQTLRELRLSWRGTFTGEGIAFAIEEIEKAPCIIIVNFPSEDG